MKETTKIAFCIDKNIFTRLSKLAESQGRTYSEIIREAIIKILKEYNA